MDRINHYIEKRYQRWLDYAQYHCLQAKMENEASDILNEVIIALLEKDKIKLNSLYNTKKGQYRELDFYVLRMIKLNIYSPTSPYQSKYKRGKIVDIEIANMNIQDCTDVQEDKSARILQRCHIVRDAFDELNLSIKARDIFEHRFIQGLPFSEWPGPEKKKELYETYNRVIKMIKEKINGRSLL